MLAVSYSCWRFYCWLRFLVNRPTPRIREKMEYVAECMIPGSPLCENGTIPKGQVAVGFYIDDCLQLVGSGVRVEDHLIVPSHCIHTGYKMCMINGAKEVPLDAEEAFPLVADVSAIPVKARHWSELGIGQTRLGPLNQSATVAITSSCDRRYSIAVLKPGPTLGTVLYDGSTQPGFSGAIYASGPTCIGMHCHGGVRGGGYELLYLYKRLQLELDSPPEEATEEYMYRMAKRGYQIDDPIVTRDRAIVRFSDGTYHLTRREMIARMAELDLDNWADETEYDELQERSGGR